MWTAIVVGMCFMVLWLFVAVLTFQYNMYWSIIIAGAACAFSAFLYMMAYTLVRDSKRRYTIEITDSEVVLNVFDGLSKKSCTQMVLIDDVKYAEYYPYCDSSSMILHTSYAQMEVPLWPLGSRGTDVLDYLIGRGVRVVNVQSDDPIPEFTVDEK
jgi:hypothetical protein